jgi:peroxiredoxin Q/BCP
LNGLKKKYEQFKQTGTEIVVISADSVEVLENYRKKNSAPFVMLSDPDCTIIKQYGVFNPSERDGIAVPVTFVVNQEGIITSAKCKSTLFRTRTAYLLKEVERL